MKAAYDVVVVGAGPAGSTAARLAAASGLDVLLIEKRQEIGSLVRCAEAVGAESLRAYIEPDDRWINARISYYAIHNSVGDAVRVPPTEPTLILERKVFDRELAHMAAKAGAEVRAKTRAVGLRRENGRVTGVQISSMGRAREVRARLVIAADGTESQVARWAGLKTVPPLRDYYVAVQFLLSGVGDKVHQAECQYHLGWSIAPGGYAWVFPKGDDTANVGLALSADRAAEVSAQAYLERFVGKHFPNASILSVVAGGIPITRALRRTVTDGLMVVGDAAHQADPLTAGGINLGMIAGDMAVQVGAEAIRRGDVSAKALRAYESAWRKRFGREHDALYRVRKVLVKMDEERLNALVKTASELPLEEMSLAQIAVALLKQHPRLLAEARTLIASGLILK
jgi:digeranylgeranylglycerophospholipid reductase